MDLDALRERTRAAWSEGDYALLAELTWQAAGPLVDACAVSAGQEVVDVAAGTGNAAVLAAREGARVVALDLTPTMVEQGRARTADDGLDVDWLVGDVEDLPFPDGSFECVLSVFGAMFAPRPERAAAELFRVLRPGGTVGLANWTPDGFQGRSFAISRSYAPPPDGVPPPTDWGDEAVVRDRLEGLASSLGIERRSVRFTFDSTELMERFFAAAAGPAIALRRSLAPERHEAMVEEQRRLVEEWNTATDGSVLIDAEYLQVVARRRG